MRAIQIKDLSGPESALELVDVAEPEASHPLTPGEGVLVDVHAAGVSFPEVLQTRGEYQLKPPLPFVPGSEVAGVVRSASDGARVRAGRPRRRVLHARRLRRGGRRAAVPHLRAPRRARLRAGRGADPQLPHRLLLAEAARAPAPRARPCSSTAPPAASARRRCRSPRGSARSTIAVVSSDEKEQVAREAGADEVVRSDGPWKDEAKELSGGGVDVVLDPVGGDRFTDSLRSLREGGRAVVVGFTGGSIPEVQGQPPAAQQHRGRRRRLGRLRAGQARAQPRDRRRDQPPDRRGLRQPDRRRALPARATRPRRCKAIDERRATGKVVLEL